MDLMGEEQLDYGEEDYGGSQKMPPFPGAIPALAEEEEEEEEMLMPEDEDYDDLYNDVNVGEGFMQTLQRRQQQPPPAPAPFGNGALPPNHKPVPLGEVAVPVPVPAAEQKSVAGFPPVKGFEEGSGNSNRVGDMVPEPQGNLGFRVAPRPAAAPPQIGGGGDPKFANAPPSLMMDPGGSAVRGAPPMAPNRAGLMGNRPEMNENTRMMVDNSNGPTMLYVGELHWWTTDAELESMASQYGRVKEIKFFDERASGKSKGYCQLEFYDPAAAAACKEGMNGYLFNGRACVVTFASAQTLRQMGASYTNKNQPPAQLQQQQQQQQQGRRPMNDGMGRAGGMNFQGGDGGRRGGWGRGGQGFNNRNQAGNGPMRGRGGVPGAKGMMGPGGAVGAGAPYGQGLAGPGLGGPAGGMMHAQNMLGAGYDPTYMGRGGPYGGFSTPGFPGMMPSFQAVNAVGLHGVAPHVNPAFFGRGMSANGMGIIGSSGMEGHSAGMWMDPSMSSWVGEEHGRGTRESSYGGDDGASDYGYGEVNHERVGKSNPPREKERGSEREWSGNSERRHRDEKERDWDRSDRERYREEKDGYRDSRQRDRDRDNDDNYDRGQSSSRSRSKIQEEDHRSRSRDTDYGKRRRPSE